MWILEIIDTGETVWVVKTFRLISSASPGTQIGSLSWMGLVNIFLPDSYKRPFPVRLINIGQCWENSWNKFNTVVNFDTVENQPSHRIVIILSSYNINNVGECLNNISYIDTSCVFVNFNINNIYGHVKSLRMLWQTHLKGTIGDSMYMENFWRILS